MLMLVSLITASRGFAGASSPAFRQKQGLITYAPPAWFLKGYFIAREKNPGYAFGPVEDFVQALGATTTWLIEDLELRRSEQTAADGKKPEYSLFLEAVSSEHTEYWVFVVLPYDNAQAWFDARRAYHGRKADDYYGETQKRLEHALSQGVNVKAELRFLIERGETSLKAPEDVIMSRYGFQPVFDLSAGQWLRPATKSK